MLLWRATKRKSKECRSKEQRSQFLELPFEFGLALWPQWFCKIPFPDSTSFELKVLLAECVTLESHEQEFWRMSQEGTEKSIFRVIFRMCFGIMTAIILQNTISRFNFFQIESFVSWVCYFGEPRKNKTVECHRKKQRTAFSELSFKLALRLWLQWFCKIPFPYSTYFELKVLIAECVTLESHEKKICWMSQQGTDEHFQSYLLNWLWHYDCNDSAKYHFQMQHLSNWKFW